MESSNTELPVSTTVEPNIQKVVLPGQTPEGQYVLSVLVKRTYDIVNGQRCARAAHDVKINPADVYYQDPMNSPVKYESDFVPFKIATDVVLNGKAYSPAGKARQSLVASLEVGQVRKDILILGDRVCHYRAGKDPSFTEPKPFTSMEIRYDYAYGGVDIYSDPKLACPYPRNPLGRGYVIKNTEKTIENLSLPNIEDPSNVITPQSLCLGHFMHWERQPMPQGFGWIPKPWQPRASLAGVMPADRAAEQQLRTIYASVIPPHQRQLYDQTRLPDMNFRFFNGASPGLTFPFLSGDETIRTVNLSPQGEIKMQLPGECPRVRLDIGNGIEEPQVVLHTVMIRMEDRHVDLVWRAAVPYPGPDWLPQMKKMDVMVQ